MNNRRLIQFISSLCIVCAFDGHICLAQDIAHNVAVESYLANMFSELDLSQSKVPTGYLLDCAFEAANIRDFDGSSLVDSNYVDINIFRNVLLTMNSSRAMLNFGILYMSRHSRKKIWSISI